MHVVFDFVKSYIHCVIYVVNNGITKFCIIEVKTFYSEYQNRKFIMCIICMYTGCFMYMCMYVYFLKIIILCRF